jgi:hypothetical protein
MKANFTSVALAGIALSLATLVAAVPVDAKGCTKGAAGCNAGRPVAKTHPKAPQTRGQPQPGQAQPSQGY